MLREATSTSIHFTVMRAIPLAYFSSLFLRENSTKLFLVAGMQSREKTVAYEALKIKVFAIKLCKSMTIDLHDASSLSITSSTSKSFIAS